MVDFVMEKEGVDVCSFSRENLLTSTCVFL